LAANARFCRGIHIEGVSRIISESLGIYLAKASTEEGMPDFIIANIFAKKMLDPVTILLVVFACLD